MLWLHITVVAAANWAVLVSTSNSWHDYRHTSNVYAMYQQIRDRGVPESNIILLTAGEFKCNARNIHAGSQWVENADIGRGILPDYRGKEVTRDTLYRVLTNRGARKGLLSDKNSNILLYLTGHGGDGVLGFQDDPTGALSVELLNSIVHEMWLSNRYKQLLLMVDSCQSETMITGIDAPNVVSIASAPRGRPSYSRERDSSMGISLIDEFSWATAQFLAAWGASTLGDLAQWYKTQSINAVIRGPAAFAFNGFFTTRIISTI